MIGRSSLPGARAGRYSSTRPDIPACWSSARVSTWVWAESCWVLPVITVSATRRARSSRFRLSMTARRVGRRRSSPASGDDLGPRTADTATVFRWSCVGRLTATARRDADWGAATRAGKTALPAIGAKRRRSWLTVAGLPWPRSLTTAGDQRTHSCAQWASMTTTRPSAP